MNSTATTAATKTVGYGNNHSFTSLGPIEFERRAPGPKDVAIEILYCGVGQKVGVIGMGGLGHLAVKLAAALGEVSVLWSPSRQTNASKVGIFSNN